LNLILNACDAMADQPPRDRRIIIAERLTDGGVVQLSVSDKGPGVAEGQLDQIFEPFMTTKEAGLGLGLAICRSIVTAHGGRLWAINAAEGGATFIIELDPIAVWSKPAGEFKPAGSR
jgi:two-component system, LuxR family, sensor kinase FixL